MTLAAAIHRKAAELGKLAVRMTTQAGSGHASSALSLAQIVTYLMYRQMRHDPADPWHPTADRLVLSEGHAVPIVYAALADLGATVGLTPATARKLTPADVDALRTRDSVLDGHPNPYAGVRFFDAATGSLGQGLSVAAGLALAARLDQSDRRIYVLIGDGESREGQIWEALDSIADHKLTSVCAIFNANGQGQAGLVSPQQSADALAAKLAAFGWQVSTIDGHDPDAIAQALEPVGRTTKPVAIVARTIKGWGVEELTKGNWHGKPLTAAQLPAAYASLDKTVAVDQNPGRESGADPNHARESGADPNPARKCGADPNHARESGADPNPGRKSGADPNPARKCGAVGDEAPPAGVPATCVAGSEGGSEIGAKLEGPPRPASKPTFDRPAPREVTWPSFHETMTAAGLGALVEKNAIGTRRAYGAALQAAGTLLPQVVALDGDVSNSTFSELFAKAHPARFVECKIAEQNMISTAVGLSAAGYIPFVNSFAKFLMRAADQIEMASISRANVKIVGSHAGISLAADGPSQMGLSDVAFFRSFTTVRGDDRENPLAWYFHPADAVAAYHCTRLMVALPGLCFMRTHRPDVPLLYAPDAKFEPGAFHVHGSGLGSAVAELAARHGRLRAEVLHVQRIPKSTLTAEETMDYCGVGVHQIADHAVALVRS